MSTARSFVMLSVISIVTIQTITSGADAATLSLVGSSTKVCQLVGETDWATGNPTAARTLSNFGLDAVDLGFPVDSGPPGPLYFLFGDALPPGHPPNSILSVPPDDAVGSTTRTTPPDSTACLDLQLITSAPKTFAHPTVQPTIQQGTFNVPSGGVFLDNTFYTFFWTDHCAFPAGLAPEPRTPLRRPPPGGACLETPESSSVGRSVLAEATSANPLAFNWTPSADGWLSPGSRPTKAGNNLLACFDVEPVCRGGDAINARAAVNVRASRRLPAPENFQQAARTNQSVSDLLGRCPLYPQKRTFASVVGKCRNRHHGICTRNSRQNI